MFRRAFIHENTYKYMCKCKQLHFISLDSWRNKSHFIAQFCLIVLIDRCKGPRNNRVHYRSLHDIWQCMQLQTSWLDKRRAMTLLECSVRQYGYFNERNLSSLFMIREIEHRVKLGAYLGLKPLGTRSKT